MSNIFEVGEIDGDSIPVQIGTKFLDLFSAQLYSSPQKAFEELIVNGWDAGASHIDVITSDNLESENAALMIVDNGESMDKAGLKKLWNIAVSDKEQNPENKGRNVIGKFGIGKLATYALAREFTYVCCDKSGKIRLVTMDYEKACNPTTSKFVDQMKLNVYRITKEELFVKLREKEKGEDVIKFIEEENRESTSEYEDEYNCTQENFSFAGEGSWTLVILSNLKEKGRKLKIGILKNMLSSALPLGSGINIRLNGASIKPKKRDIDTIKSWEIGKENDDIGDFLEGDFGDGEEKIKITHNPTDKSIEIDGVGRVTGKFTLYEDEISSGKSAERGASNGFHVNVLGRVVNQSDNYFGTKNMHHGTWSRFRCTVRVDGLNDYLNVHRESFRDIKEIVIFREFLQNIFNTARALYDSNDRAALAEMEDLWVKKLGFVATDRLRNFINDTAKGENDFRKRFFQIKEGDESIKKWNKNLEEKGEKVIDFVKIGKLSSGSSDEDLVKYDLSSKSIVLNEMHPFVSEFKGGHKEKRVLETIISAVFLSDIYSLDIGVEDAQLKEIIKYRENIMKAKATVERRSVATVINLLNQSERLSLEPKLFEEALSSAFRCLGFKVEHKGKPGDPDGIASADVIPGIKDDSDKNNVRKSYYKLTYDAKTTKDGPVTTGNLNLEAIKQHKEEHQADYAVVVAPDYETGGRRLINSLKENKGIVCLTTSQINELLEITGKYGIIAHDKFREIFNSSVGVGEKIDEKIDFIRKYKQEESNKFSMRNLLNGLRNLENDPDLKYEKSLSMDTIAYVCRQTEKNPIITADKVSSLIRAIEGMVPEHVVVENNNVYFETNIDKIIEEFEKSISQIESDEEEDQ